MTNQKPTAKEQEQMTELEIKLLEMLVQKMYRIAASKIESEIYPLVSDMSVCQTENLTIFRFYTRDLNFYNATTFDELLKDLETANELNKAKTA